MILKKKYWDLKRGNNIKKEQYWKQTTLIKNILKQINVD